MKRNGKSIYLVFSYTGTLFSKLLRIFTRDKYVHVSLAFDENLKEAYSFGRKNPKHVFPAGLIKENFVNILDVFKNTECLIYKMEISHKSYRKLKKILKTFFKEEKKYQYDILGLPLIYIKKSYQRKYHRVCSQFIGYLLQESEIYDFKIHYSLITPIHFYKIENKELYYQGALADYLNKKNK